MYWVGYVNSGKGVNEWGSWTSLSDKEWRTNGKYDTALYEIDIETGAATMLSKVANRWTFSALWVDEDDNSDGAGIDVTADTPGFTGYIALSTSDGGAIWQQVKIGVTYTYRLEPAIGWQIHSVTFNNQDVTAQVSDAGTYTTPAISNAHSTLFVTFEQDGNGIGDVKSKASDVRILAHQGGISIENAQAGDQLQIYSVDGVLLLSKRLESSHSEVALDPQALYLIHVADKVVKVRL